MNDSLTLQNILLVNKDLNNTLLIEKALDTLNGSIEIMRAENADQGLHIIERQIVDIIFLDYQSSANDRKFLSAPPPARVGIKTCIFLSGKFAA